MLLKECTGCFSFRRTVRACIDISVEESELAVTRYFAERLFFTCMSFVQKLPPLALQRCALPKREPVQRPRSDSQRDL